MDDLKLIKKYYGEEMMRFCRNNFSTLLETEGLLFSLIDSRFNRDKNLYKEIERCNQKDKFASFIMSIIRPVGKDNYVDINNPFKLMRHAGYTLYKCETEDDIQKFKKYYAPDEELCTFKGGRLESCDVFFAIKDNAEKLDRRQFKNPKREDEYGTSVISIQFTKGVSNRISIKNRYNHSVSNPDATFSNNLDNIIPSLTHSFENYFGYNFNNDNLTFYLPNYVQGSDNKFYYYNYEINNIYYCPNNIILKPNRVVKDYFNNPERYILMDYYVLDLKEKKLFLFDRNIEDSFIDSIGTIRKIDLIKEDNNKIITLYTDNKKVIIKLNRLNEIVEYTDNYIEHIDNNYLKHNIFMEKIHLDNVKTIGDKFMAYNLGLEELSLDSIVSIGNMFLYQNRGIRRINISNVREIGSFFLDNNRSLKEINIPNVLYIPERFMTCCCTMEKIHLDNVKTIGDNFMSNATALREVYLDNVVKIGNSFLVYNRVLHMLYAPKLIEVGNSFLYSNCFMDELVLLMLIKTGNDFMICNNSLEKVSFPNLRTIGSNFLINNTVATDVDIPLLKKYNNSFLRKVQKKNKVKKIGSKR